MFDSDEGSPNDLSSLLDDQSSQEDEQIVQDWSGDDQLLHAIMRNVKVLE